MATLMLMRHLELREILIAKQYSSGENVGQMRTPGNHSGSYDGTDCQDDHGWVCDQGPQLCARPSPSSRVGVFCVSTSYNSETWSVIEFYAF